MTDRDAILAAIIANPADDTVRLIYADWLEENGDGVRAAFIRENIADRRSHPTFTPSTLRALKDKGGVPGALYIVRKDIELEFAPAIPGVAWTVRRGFAEGVTLSAEVWARMADDLVARYPIQSVEVTTICVLNWKGFGSEWSIGGHSRFVTDQEVIDQRKRDGETFPNEAKYIRDGNNYPISPNHDIAHILRALWPSIPLAGWKLPEVQRGVPDSSAEYVNIAGTRYAIPFHAPGYLRPSGDS